MSEELARLTLSVEHIEKTLDDILPQIAEHEKACNIHAPMARQAHEATTEMSIFMSNQDLKLNALIERNDKKDIEDAKFQKRMYDKFDEISKATNQRDLDEAKRVGREEAQKEAQDKKNMIYNTLITLLIGFSTWVALSIIEGKENDAKNHAPTTKAVKKSKHESDEA